MLISFLEKDKIEQPTCAIEGQQKLLPPNIGRGDKSFEATRNISATNSIECILSKPLHHSTRFFSLQNYRSVCKVQPESQPSQYTTRPYFSDFRLQLPEHPLQVLAEELILLAFLKVYNNPGSRLS